MSYTLISAFAGTICRKQEIDFDDLLYIKSALKSYAKTYTKVGMKKEGKEVMATHRKLTNFINNRYKKNKITKRKSK